MDVFPSNIFLSSMVFGSNISKISNESMGNKYAIEFSSGIPYQPDLISKMMNYSGKKIIHNYFPAPKHPFVLNLASSNKLIRKQSIEHCRKGLEISASIDAPFYCAHAGFLIDPPVNQLGRKIEIDQLPNSKEQELLFLDSIFEVLKFAEEYNVQFFIENNVLAPFNLKTKNLSNLPFLCCESENISSIFSQVKDDRFGLLLDTAHLKVTCKTLNISLDDEFLKIKHLVKALHHSDNDGHKDSNQQLTEKYWFLKYYEDFKTLPQVIEVRDLSKIEIEQHLNLLK